MGEQFRDHFSTTVTKFALSKVPDSPFNQDDDHSQSEQLEECYTMHIEVVVDGNYVIEYVVGKTDFSLYTLRYPSIPVASAILWSLSGQQRRFAIS